MRMEFDAMIRRLVLLAVATFGLCASGAQSSPTFMRYPTGSGTMIAFVARGDLWTASRDGGNARRLVRSAGYVAAARFSPDGGQIAFTQRSAGGQDVYVIAAAGGPSRRLTHDALPGVGDNLVVGWSPDSTAVIFLSTRISVATKQVHAYAVKATGGPATRLPFGPVGRLDVGADGRVAMTRTFTDLATRKRYVGGMAEDVFVYDPANRQLDRVTDWRGTDGAPMWAGHRLYYLSDRGTGFRLNLWCHDFAGSSDRQVTFFRDFDVDWPSIGNGRILFQQGGRLWAMELPGERLHALNVNVPDDGARTLPRYVAAGREARAADVTGGTDYAVSPDGKSLILAARGDLFGVDVTGGAAVNLTATPDRDEDHPAVSPDGRLVAYVTEDSASQQLAVRLLAGGPQRQLTRFTDAVLYTPTFSPAGDLLAVADAQHRLWLVGGDGRSSTLVAHDPLAEIRDATFSPDGALLAYSTMRPNGLSALHLYRIAAGHDLVISGELDGDRLPAFSANGMRLIFVSQRHETVVTGDRGDEASLASIGSDGPYSLPLTADVPAMARASALMGAAAVSGRITMLTRRGDAIFYETRPPAGIAGDLPGSAELHRLTPGGKDEILLHGFDSQMIAGNGTNILYRRDGGWLARLPDGTGQPVDLGRIRLRVDPRAEWREMVEHAWRLDRDLFFSRVMNGSDWSAVRRAYWRLLPLVGSRDDAQYLIGQIQGEIATSHAYLAGLDADQVQRLPRTPRLGADLEVDPLSGRFRLARIFAGDSSRPRFRAPFNDPARATPIREGTFLIAIDGVELHRDQDPDALLVGKTGTVVLTLADSAEGPRRLLTVLPLASDLDLRQHDWVEGNRARVTELSAGRVGYMFLGDFSGAGSEDLQRQYQGQLGKQGMIIDLRWNRGGYTSQAVLNLLRRMRAGGFVNRDGAVSPLPAVTAPPALAVIVNAQTASDGDQFAYFFRAFGLGPIVGQRTWGGVQGIQGPWPLMDGTTITIPKDSLATADGRWIIENAGVEPDIHADPAPDEAITGRDRMLDTAVSTALARLSTDPNRQPIAPPPLPAYPVEGIVPGASFGASTERR